jgi:hypothetical protein
MTTSPGTAWLRAPEAVAAAYRGLAGDDLPAEVTKPH